MPPEVVLARGPLLCIKGTLRVGERPEMFSLCLLYRFLQGLLGLCRVDVGRGREDEFILRRRCAIQLMH